MSTIEDKYAALGLNPPGDGHDLEQTYHETVQNIIRHHRDAVMRAADPLAPPHELATADQHLAQHKERLSKISKEDYDRAVEAIRYAESLPQHVAPVGGEPTASVDDETGGQ